MRKQVMQRRVVATAGGALATLAVIVLPGPWGTTGTPGPRGSATPGAALDSVAHRPPLGDAERGRRLFGELDCVRCHTEPRTGHDTNVPATLRGAGSRSRATWLAAYLLEPAPLRYIAEGVRPGLCMPRLVVSSVDARDLAAWLATWRDTVLVPEVAAAESWAADTGLVDEGRLLFDQYQCRGCHRLAGRGGEVGPALDGVGSRRRASYVLALIQDPDRMIPGTAMENKDLWPEEARAITGYLMTLTSGAHEGRGPDAAATP